MLDSLSFLSGMACQNEEIKNRFQKMLFGMQADIHAKNAYN